MESLKNYARELSENGYYEESDKLLNAMPSVAFSIDDIKMDIRDKLYIKIDNDEFAEMPRYIELSAKIRDYFSKIVDDWGIDVHLRDEQEVETEGTEETSLI